MLGRREETDTWDPSTETSHVAEPPGNMGLEEEPDLAATWRRGKLSFSVVYKNPLILEGSNGMGTDSD